MHFFMFKVLASLLAIITMLGILGPTHLSASECDVKFTGMEITGDQVVGNPITITINAQSDCAGTIYYRFSYHPDYGTVGYDGKHWYLMAGDEYQTRNKCTYTFNQEGKYIVVVWAVSDPNNVVDGVPIIGFSIDIKDVPHSQSMAEKLWGTWRFTYTIISTYDDAYYLNSSIIEHPSIPGEYVILGTDELGDIVVAGYSADHGEYCLLDSSTFIDKYYVFNFDGPDTVSGCYYQDYADDNLNICYPMVGTRVSTYDTGQRKTLQRAQTLDAQQLDEAAEVTGGNPPDQRVVDAYHRLKEVADSIERIK